MAGDYLYWAQSPLERLVSFLVITLATAVAATVVIRLAYVEGGADPTGRPPEPRGRHVLAEAARRVGIGCAVVLPLSVGVGAVTENWAQTAVRTDMGLEMGVAPYTGLKAGAAWALFMALLALGVLCCAALRGRGPLRPRVRGERRAQVQRLLVFVVLFWLGAEITGMIGYLSIRQVPGQSLTDFAFLSTAEDMAFVNRRAAFRSCVFLMIACIVAGLDLPGGCSRPTRLDFRAPVRTLWAALPACLGRGLLFATGPAVVLALVTPASPGIPWWERFAAAGAFSAFFGILFGAGLAVLRWARTPADLDQETPQSTLRGDRTVAVALLVFGLLPPLIKWFVTVEGQLADSDNQSVQGVGRWLETFEANLSMGLAVALLAVSSTAYFAYRETGLRLATAKRLPQHPLSFMEDARLLSVLRRVGPVYQFCHAEFKDRIVGGASAAGDMAPPGGARV
jgi:hypothetical protein